MKTFSSQMSEKAKGCVWMSMMYSVTAIVLCIVLVLLSERNVDNLMFHIHGPVVMHSNISHRI